MCICAVFEPLRLSIKRKIPFFNGKIQRHFFGFRFQQQQSHLFKSIIKCVHVVVMLDRQEFVEVLADLAIMFVLVCSGQSPALPAHSHG